VLAILLFSISRATIVQISAWDFLIADLTSLDELRNEVNGAAAEDGLQISAFRNPTFAIA
jgi:hypothetical protein